MLNKKMRIKQNALAVLLVSCLFLSFGVTTYAATSYYGFELNYRVVDGKENGEYHTLNAGTVYISGTHEVYSVDAGVITGTAPLYYVLLKDQVGPDVNCGSIQCSISESPSGVLGTADKDSSKYYLQVYKVEDDGYNITGSGKIYN